MTVYFARKVESPTEIKIGTANDLDRRLNNVARAVGPLHLFASMPGGVAIERDIQLRFSHLRIEGEWFRSNDEIENFIRVIAGPENCEYGPKGRTWKTKAQVPLARRENDARCALTLLDMMFERYPRQTGITKCLEMAFAELHEVNNCWTRRRVRAIRELKSLRIDAFEIVDLLTVLGIPRPDWAEYLDPKQKDEPGAISHA